MRNSVPPLPSAFAGLVLLLAAGPGVAEVPKSGLIVFKDGFVLHGFVVREKKIINDLASGQPVELQEGFFLVDDVTRRIVFSPSQVEKVIEDQAFAPDEGAFRSKRTIDLAFARPLPPIRAVVEAGPFDSKWDRDFRYSTTSRTVTARQHLSVLSPHFTRIDSIPQIQGGAMMQPYRWSAFYLTRELGAEQVRGVLAMHPDLKEGRDLPLEERAGRRLKIAQFLVRAGWLPEAREELERLRDLPGQKEKAETGLEAIKKLEAMQLAEDLKRAYRAGQFHWFEKHLADFNEDGLDERPASEVRALRAQYETAAGQMKLAQRLLKELSEAIVSTDARVLVEAATAVHAELTPDHVGRLETFLTQAQQAERQRKAGLAPELAPPQLLALAVSGWLLGNTAAESKPEVGRRLWRARQFVLKYQKCTERGERQQLLADYETQRTEAVPLDEMAQLIAFLPPPEAEEKIERGTRELTTTGQARITYALQLPAEYVHSRSCPVLVALHQAGEKPRDMLERWSDLADKNGYILVAPAWTQGFQAEYGYTYREHAAVLEVLRDLRRRFQVDSDRVFLTGLGQGGDMAYDVGLSHPDLFAGVVPMGAFPGPFPFRYRHNGQYLPFCVITGDRSGDSRDNKAMFQEWVPHGYPVLYVLYRGRGLEWFGGEMPFLFEWMEHKKRANPITELGRIGGPVGDEFLTMRSTDNHFYWLSTDGLSERQRNEGSRYDSRILGATLQANRGGNHINVRVQGLKQVTVWLGNGEGTIDFDKPLAVYLNTTLRWNKKVNPSREVMLEDFWARGDRQRLYVARVDFDLQ